MKLLLVRHGRTLANVAGALDTSLPGLPLDAVGLEQAASLPGRLTADGHLTAITSLWVSPILRARETIAPIEAATGLTAQVRSGLREVLAGDIEMNTDARSVRCYTDTTRSWMVGRTGARIPGSPEDGADTFERFNGVVEEIAAATDAEDPDSSALLVAHGTVLRLWVALAAARAAGADPAWVAEHPMRNTGITVVHGDPQGGWRLTSWNEGDWSA
ncbi:MAG: histidine phosphatase family protein [Actinomyces sp.]|uniref:histidine phosphatase family protein n=1 Tax=Actinomyces sp. TaxID=29317 RepID=UPI0026DB0803|nr:histidine phosphatase family protein [Actinomyces sp.]MDO4242572.1 histidine phosphatase family protein [Actinomyces sp.]